MKTPPDEFLAVLDEVIALIHFERYRYLSLEQPDPIERAKWRQWVLDRHARRGAPTPKPHAYPPLAQQAANLAGALGRVIAAAVKGEPIKVPAEVLEQRRSICRECPLYDPCRGRCTKCGCMGQKLEFAGLQCPDDPPRWGRWSPPATPGMTP